HQADDDSRTRAICQAAASRRSQGSHGSVPGAAQTGFLALLTCGKVSPRGNQSLYSKDKEGPPMRLGDDIDDHCSRCKRATDHSIVSKGGEKGLRTRCRTCNYEHAYRHNKGGRKEMTAKEAFDKLVASMPGAQQETPSGKSEKRNGEGRRSSRSDEAQWVS